MGRLDKTVPKKVKLTRGRKRGMKHQYKRENKQRYGGLWPPKGLASEAKPAHVVFSVGTRTKPLACASGLTFQAHSLQMILWGAYLLTSPILSWNCYKLGPYNWRRLWEGLYPGMDDS